MKEGIDHEYRKKIVHKLDGTIERYLIPVYFKDIEEIPVWLDEFKVDPPAAPPPVIPYIKPSYTKVIKLDGSFEHIFKYGKVIESYAFNSVRKNT